MASIGGKHRWQASVASEALASTLNCDPLLATRLQLAEQVLPLKAGGVDSVVAVPVYGSAATFTDSGEALRSDGLQDAVLTEVVLPRLPVPAGDVPLQAIVDLRRRDSFKEATFNLRKWQESVLPELFDVPEKHEKHMRAAAADFDRWVKQYSEVQARVDMYKLSRA